MIIGTVRIDEARAYDSHEGYHEFHADETQEPYGSFEVYFLDVAEAAEISRGIPDYLAMSPGWYWVAAFPGHLPDGDPVGPFARSSQAHEDADEWSPEYDED